VWNLRVDAAKADVASDGHNREQGGQRVVDRLWQAATRAQAPLLSWLAANGVSHRNSGPRTRSS
jgi:hypothetical protein